MIPLIVLIVNEMNSILLTRSLKLFMSFTVLFIFISLFWNMQELHSSNHDLRLIENYFNMFSGYRSYCLEWMQKLIDQGDIFYK